VHPDLIVVGAGAVGASLARAARGLRVTLVSHEPRAVRTPPGEGFDARVYALSPGNVAFLQEIGVALPAARITPVHAMRVFGDDGASSIEFDAYRAGMPALAWIVEDGVLQDALCQGLEVEVGEVERFEVHEQKILVSLKNRGTLEANLLVGADGANSTVRRLARIEAKESDYGQSAVVANFRCAKPHASIAYQWFLGGAVLALLPLPRGQVSMVWSLPQAEAARISALPARDFCKEVEQASRGVLGALELSCAPKSYVLRRLAAQHLVAPRVALVGDAGHVVHPLAGQGLNLGLQDARALAHVLAGREPVRDAGELALLRRYERARAEPILTMAAGIEGLYRLFGAEGAFAARLRNAGLNLVDRVPVLKNALARQAMQ